MKNRILIILVILCSSSIVNAFDHGHQIFDKLLKEYVVYEGAQSFVKYSKLKSKPEDLKTYLKKVSGVSKEDFKNFTKEQRLAFLINAYNAFTLKVVIDHYPIESIKDIGSLFTSTWKKKFFTIFGEESYLDHIEHDLIRKNFNEPRIHFAVNCASIGCPSLLNRAFVAEKLTGQLESVAKSFLTNRSKNKFQNGKLEVSKIFKWYGEDFVKKYGSVEKFIAPYMSADKVVQARIASKKFSLDWTDYNWNLNSK